MPSLLERFKNGWNAFASRDPTLRAPVDYGVGYYQRPYQRRLNRGNERTIITAIYNTISLDVAAIPIRHVRVDQDGRYLEDIKDSLNECLTLRANTDQTARDFIQDLVLSMFDEGCVAVVPVETTSDPKNGAFGIRSLRVAKIVQWYPQHVKVRVYNEWTGKQEDLTLPKSMVSIHTNPHYAVMNEPNSTLKRLIRKLTLLDIIDENNGSGKLDLIIQLPYVVKNSTRQKQAEERRKQIELQLAESKYGIAYTDGTERITQLNRPVENNLLKQIESLTSTLYGQLGITEAVMNGTADEKTMLNYYNRSVEPVLAAIADPMIWSFLTQTARTQGQSIKYFREPFRFVPLTDTANVSDILLRNEVATSNEIRQVIGWRPSDDPRADLLLNSNMPQDETVPSPGGGEPMMTPNEEANPMDTPVSEITNRSSGSGANPMDTPVSEIMA